MIPRKDGKLIPLQFWKYNGNDRAKQAKQLLWVRGRM